MGVTSSKVADGGVPDPEDDDEVDPWRALDKAGRVRDLSDDESDDDSTSVFSLCTRAKDGINEDKEVKSYRKFFFGYINECLALMRTIESMNYASTGGKDKSTTHNNNTETKPDGLCLMEGCGKIHRSARSKKATQSLAFCDVFKGMNLKQRTAVAKKLSACNWCLQPGHGIKTVKTRPRPNLQVI